MDSVHKLFTINRFIFIFAIIGIVIAAYVTQSFLRGASILCVNEGCELVRKNPASYIYGLPVPAVGLVGYSFIAILSFLRTALEKYETNLLKGILGMATFGCLFVVWFTYTEVFVIKGMCTWCAISAINMLIIFGLSAYSYVLLKK